MKDILLSENQRINNYALLTQLSSLFLNSSLDGVKLEITEFFKTLLEPDPENDFIEAFYSKVFPTFITFIFKSNDPNTIFLVLEILIFFTETNRNRVIPLLIRTDNLRQLMILLFPKEKYLKLSMLKLLRSMLYHNNEEINQYFIRNNLLAPLFGTIRVNKDNLLTSACYNILNLIVTQNMQTLIQHIMENNKSLLEEEKYKANPVIDKLRTGYNPIVHNTAEVSIEPEVEEKLPHKRFNPEEDYLSEDKNLKDEGIKKKKLDESE